jgi:hypothetical protein
MSVQIPPDSAIKSAPEAWSQIFSWYSFPPEYFVGIRKLLLALQTRNYDAGLTKHHPLLLLGRRTWPDCPSSNWASEHLESLQSWLGWYERNVQLQPIPRKSKGSKREAKVGGQVACTGQSLGVATDQLYLYLQ